MANQQYLVKKRVLKGTSTWGFIIEKRKKEYKIPKEDLITLIEQERQSAILNYKGKTKSKTKTKTKGKAKGTPPSKGEGEDIVYLDVFETTDKKGEPKKSFKTFTGTVTPGDVPEYDSKNKLNDLSSVDIDKVKKIQDFKMPEKKLIAV